MNPGQIGNTLLELWDDLQQPDLFWQVAVLLGCLAIAWFLARSLHRPSADAGAWRIGRGGVNRLIFPLVALGLVLLSRLILRQWLHTNLLSIAVPLLISFAVIRAVVYALRQAFAPSGWLATFERVVALVAWSVVALHLTGLLPDLIAALEAVSFSAGKQKLSLWLVLQGTATVLVTLVLALWVGGIVEARLHGAEGLDANLRIVLSRVTKAVLILLAVLISLPLVGLDLTALSVFGGALGVGIGFGLQKIASNYLAGFIILLDRSIRLGNMITVDKFSGQVTQITTRYTVLRGLTGVESIVPNELLIGSVVQNETYTNTKVRQAVTVQVGYQCDVEQAMRILIDAALRHERVLRDPAPEAALLRFTESGIDLELGFWIDDPHLGGGGLKSAINLDIWREFKRAGIEIPYPRREVRLLNALNESAKGES